MTDRFGRPSQRERRSAQLLRLAAFVPLTDHLRNDGRAQAGLASSIRIALDAGASIKDVADILQQPPDHIAYLLEPTNA